MLKWMPKHKFLFEWMEEIKRSRPLNWGQVLPTEVLHKNSAKFLDSKNPLEIVTLIGQHEMLLHPAYATEGGKKKGPLFPPFDTRIKSLPLYDEYIY